MDHRKIVAIRALSDHAADHVRERLPKIYSRELIDVIFEQPYCRIANLVDKGIAQRQAAARYLKSLVEIDVLQEMQLGKEKLFLHPRLLQLLKDDGNRVTGYGA
jgi:Fic family protein